jgi:adiponectin receptor
MSSGNFTRSEEEKSREPSAELEALPPLDRNGTGEDADLLSYEEIPSWYQDNPFIWHGYRPVCNSATTCFRSWFRLHNEFINIHSHLWSAVAFLLGELFVLAPLHLRYTRVSAGDYAVLAVFLLTATACFGFSAAYHTFICHSQAAEAFWLRLDFVGIILLILGSFMTSIYVTFWCELTLKIIYWVVVGRNTLSQHQPLGSITQVYFRLAC